MTLFDDVYKQYFRLTNDIETKKIYTIDYSYKVLNDYLEYAISIFGEYCYKNLNDTIPYQLQTYTFESDGMTKDYVLSPIPPKNCEFYIKINNIEIENNTYSFNINTNTLSFKTAPITKLEIYIGAYYIGSFNDTLNIQEINLLAEGMTIPFNDNKLNNSLLMNNSVFGVDYHPYSPANHIKEVRTTITSAESKWLQRIKNYMWKQATNIEINNLHG